MSAPEPGILTGDKLSLRSPQQQPPLKAVKAQPFIQTMQASFGPDGHTVYKPVTDNPNASSFSGRPAGNGNGAFGGEGINFGIGGGGGGSDKKRRGRPRKDAPDGSMSVPPVNAMPAIEVPFSQPLGGFSTAPQPLPPPQQQQQKTMHHSVTENQHHQHTPHRPENQLMSEGGSGGLDSSGKKRGRPPGSMNKKQHQSQQNSQHQEFDALGSPAIGFTPHVITVNTGEDVYSKIMSFSQNGPRAICILSANGTISSVSLRQATTSGSSVTYEGRFEILSLSGSFMLSDNIGGCSSRSGGLSVSLAGPDGRVIGGVVAGLLAAASPVQVVVGSFIADGRKEPKIQSPTEPMFTSSKHHSVTGLPGPSSPSHGTDSESSDGPGSPPNHNANLPWK